MVRSTVATVVMSGARSIGQALGTELVVELSEHSIETKMEVPDTDQRAWDDDLYRTGQLYYSGYANPFKPVIREADDREELDEPDVEESDVAADEDDASVGMMPSRRYRAYLDQHLISELVRPEDRWQLLVYAVLAIGFLQMVTIAVIVHLVG